MNPRQSNAEQTFERFFKGVWRKRWWMPGPGLVRFSSYSSGKITGDVVAVHGRADDGMRVTFTLNPGDQKITGYRRVAAGEEADE